MTPLKYVCTTALLRSLTQRRMSLGMAIAMTGNECAESLRGNKQLIAQQKSLAPGQAAGAEGAARLAAATASAAATRAIRWFILVLLGMPAGKRSTRCATIKKRRLRRGG